MKEAFSVKTRRCGDGAQAIGGVAVAVAGPLPRAVAALRSSALVLPSVEGLAPCLVVQRRQPGR